MPSHARIRTRNRRLRIVQKNFIGSESEVINRKFYKGLDIRHESMWIGVIEISDL